MTTKEQTIFKKMTKDHDKASQRSLYEYTEGVLNEIEKLVPDNLQKYRVEQINKQDIAIVIEVLKSRKRAINKELSFIRQLYNLNNI